jgi:hypothetical protein
MAQIIPKIYTIFFIVIFNIKNKN